MKNEIIIETVKNPFHKVIYGPLRKDIYNGRVYLLENECSGTPEGVTTILSNLHPNLNDWNAANPVFRIAKFVLVEVESDKSTKVKFTSGFRFP